MALNAILLARALGPEGYGVFAGCYAVAGLSAFVISFGMDTWLLREAASRFAPVDLSAKVIQVKMKIGLVWGLVLVAIVPTIRPDLFSPWLMLICVLDVWSDSCFNTHVAALNVQKRIRVISRLVLLSRGGRLLGTILVASLGWVAPLDFALSRFSATLLSLILAWIVLKPNFRNQIRLGAKEILRQTMPYGTSEFLALIYAQADITLLAFLAGKTAAGIYAPATGLINALFVIPNAGFTLAVPRLTALSSQGPQRLKSFIFRLHLGFLFLGCALAVAVGFGGKWMIALLLGNRFNETGALLIVLSPILLFKAMEYLYAAIFVAMGWQKLRLIPQSISAGANILLNVLAIPLFGVYGVAVVYCLSELLLLLGYGYLAVKWMRSLAEAKN